jgi:hypothetical protein
MIAENMFGVSLHEWQGRLRNAPRENQISNLLGPVSREHSIETVSPRHLGGQMGVELEHLESAFGKAERSLLDFEMQN